MCGCSILNTPAATATLLIAFKRPHQSADFPLLSRRIQVETDSLRSAPLFIDLCVDLRQLAGSLLLHVRARRIWGRRNTRGKAQWTAERYPGPCLIQMFWTVDERFQVECWYRHGACYTIYTVLPCFLIVQLTWLSELIVNTLLSWVCPNLVIRWWKA